MDISLSRMDGFNILAILRLSKPSLSLLRGGKIMILQKDLCQVQDGSAVRSLLRRDCDTNRSRGLCPGKKGWAQANEVAISRPSLAGLDSTRSPRSRSVWSVSSARADCKTSTATSDHLHTQPNL